LNKGEKTKMNVDEMTPLLHKLGDKAWQFRVKKTPGPVEPFYLYKHDRHYLALGEKGEAWVFSPELDKYIPSDWQTELNRFAASLDYDLHPCKKPGCNCGERVEEMAAKRAPWEVEIQAARKANAAPYSHEHHEAEFKHFCKIMEQATGNPVMCFRGSMDEARQAFEQIARVSEGRIAVEVAVPGPHRRVRGGWNPTQKGPVN
jgi:hypothetical protein